MKFSEQKGDLGYRIVGYGSGWLELQQGGERQRITESFVITPDQLLLPWPVATVAALQPDHLIPIVALEPALLLLGSGERLHFPTAAQLAPLLQAGIGCEVMDSAAACRTFNLLAAEGRAVAAALLVA